MSSWSWKQCWSRRVLHGGKCTADGWTKSFVERYAVDCLIFSLRKQNKNLMFQHRSLWKGERKGYKNCALFDGKNVGTIICSPQHKLQLIRGERIFSLCGYRLAEEEANSTSTSGNI